MNQLRTGFLVLALVGLFLACQHQQSSESGGAVRGVVHDAAGSALPGATIDVGGHMTVSNQRGEYRVAGVPPGKHPLRVSLEGFEVYESTPEVRAGKDVVIDATLTLTSVAQQIVSAEAPVYASAEAAHGHTSSRDEAVRGGVVGGIVGGVVGGVAGGVVGVAVVPWNTSAMKVAAAPASRPAHGADRESYAHLAESRFFTTEEEKASTFSIDVDRASYSNVRRMLREGRRPPADAVRLEEMVNYFPYDYAPPAGNEPFSMAAEIATAPWNRSSRLMRIGIQAKKLAPWNTPANNLVFLVDVSGSMQSEDKLPLVKSAFRMLVDQMRPQDTVAIVVYAGAAGVVLEPTPGSEKDQILDALLNLEAGGSTAGGAGIRLAYSVARTNFLQKGNNRVILATDGDFNVGVSSEDELEELIVRQRESGIALTVLGFGTGNIQDAKMEILADKGNGNYAYVDSLLEAQKVFVEELGGTLFTVAKDVKIQVEFDPAAVKSWRLIGYENRALQNEDFSDDRKDAGELGAGHSVTALYEIVPQRAAGRVATIRLRYKDPRGSESRLIEQSMTDKGTVFEAASVDFRFAASVAQFAMLLKGSQHKGDATMAEVLSTARSARGMDREGYRGEFLELVERARELTPRVIAKGE